MTKRLTSEKEMRFLCFLCCVAYFMSYLTRLNYAACMVELTSALGIGKSVAGLPVTMCFLSYGVGQLICGILGDRFSPQKMIFTGLAGASACNLAVAIFPRMSIIIVLWCLNGFFQSMLWPPMVRIMAEMLNDKWYRHSCVLVSMASSAATIAIYVFTPLCIRISGWRAVFVIPAAAGIAAAFFWIVKTMRLGGREDASEEMRSGSGQTEAEDGQSKSVTEKSDSWGGSKEVQPDGRRESLRFRQLFVQAPLILILLAIIMQGTLRDGITTWMPVYMSEMFGMSNSSSILSAAALPVFAVFSTLFASFLLGRLKSEIFTAELLFGAGILAGGVLFLFFDGVPAVCIVMMTVITGCMHGINLMLISRVPGHFAGFGKVSTVSGVLNAATYIGSALSTYCFGAVAEGAGWKTVVLLWLAVALLGMLAMLSAKGKWAKFCNG